MKKKVSKKAKKKAITLESVINAIKSEAVKSRKYTDEKNEELAMMVQRGFREVNERLETMPTKAEMNKRFDQAEKKKEALAASFFLDLIGRKYIKMRVVGALFV